MHIYLYTYTSTKCLHIYFYLYPIYIYLIHIHQQNAYIYIPINFFVSCAKEPYNRDYNLQKRPIILPYTYISIHMHQQNVYIYIPIYIPYPCMRASTKLLASGMSAKFLYMGWLRWVGSLKLFVPFANEPYKKDYTLQKRLII